MDRLQNLDFPVVDHVFLSSTRSTIYLKMGKIKGAQSVRHQKGFRTYSNEKLTDALSDIQRGISIRTAAATHGIYLSLRYVLSKIRYHL